MILKFLIKTETNGNLTGKISHKLFKDWFFGVRHKFRKLTYSRYKPI